MLQFHFQSNRRVPLLGIFRDQPNLSLLSWPSLLSDLEHKGSNTDTFCLMTVATIVTNEWKLFRFSKMNVNDFAILLIDVTFNQ